MNRSSKWRPLHTFYTFSKAEKRIFLAGATLLPCTVVGLRLFGYLHSSARIEQWAEDRHWNRVAEDESTCVRRTVQLMGLAMRYLPLQGNCLSQSLTLFGLLKCQGIASDLRIGVRNIDGQFQAHAWIEYQGQPVNEMADVKNRFVPFSESVPLHAKSISRLEANAE